MKMKSRLFETVIRFVGLVVAAISVAQIATHPKVADDIGRILLGHGEDPRQGTPKTGGNLSSELDRIGVRSAIVIRSQAIDEEPVWSPAGDAIAANVEGTWRRVDLAALSLVKADWHGGVPIGLAGSSTPTELPASDVNEWKKLSKHDPRKVTTRSGTVVELRSEDLGVAFVMTPKGKPGEVVWKTSLENCHGLALSPDEQLVAFLCELNGLVVTKL